LANHPQFQSLIALLGNAKFVNFCGQPGARLDVDQSLYGEHDTRSKKIILRIMNVILFGSPDAQSKKIHMIWVDETIVQPRWKDFINRLTTEWNGYTIFVSYAFVLYCHTINYCLSLL
jgi:hypothetical protein